MAAMAAAAVGSSGCTKASSAGMEGMCAQGSASTRADLNNNAVTEYNDAKGRTLEDILGVIRKAKEMARELAHEGAP
jgi:hypothetical protein